VRHVLFGVRGIVDVEQGCGGGFECAMSASYRFSMLICILGRCVCVWGGGHFCGVECVWQVDSLLTPYEQYYIHCLHKEGTLISEQSPGDSNPLLLLAIDPSQPPT
jgi:hypothetical protein